MKANDAVIRRHRAATCEVDIQNLKIQMTVYTDGVLQRRLSASGNAHEDAIPIPDRLALGLKGRVSAVDNDNYGKGPGRKLARGTRGTF